MSAEGKKFCPEAATDVELLNRVAEHGCDLAFQELINRHGGLVRRVVGGVLKGQCPFEDRKDVEQEVWKRIWEYRRPFDTNRGSTVAALIGRIVRNAALTHVLRSTNRNEHTIDENELDILQAPERAAKWLRDSFLEKSFIILDIINRVLGELNDEHLAIVCAVFAEHEQAMTYKQLAKRFDTTESNIKTVIYRFKQRCIELRAKYREGNGH